MNTESKKARFQTFYTNWNRVDAVLALFVGYTLLKANEDLHIRLRQPIEQAFDGFNTDLEQNADLVRAQKAKPVSQAVQNLKASMDALKIGESKKMPAVLWIRLANENHLQIDPYAIQKFGKWNVRSGLKGAYLLRCEASATEPAPPSLGIKAWADAVGYTQMEMLLTQKDDADWPYHQKWKTVFVPRPEIPFTQPESNQTEANGDESSAGGLKTRISAPSQASTAMTRQQKIDGILKRCGIPVTLELKRCLEKEAKRADGLVPEVTRQDGRYTSSLSLDALVKRLRARHAKLREWSESTLKTALPLSVACPRGRPIAIAIKKPLLLKSTKKRR